MPTSRNELDMSVDAQTGEPLFPAVAELEAATLAAAQGNGGAVTPQATIDAQAAALAAANPGVVASDQPVSADTDPLQNAETST